MTRLGFPRVLGAAAVVYLLAMAAVFALLSVQSSAFDRQARQTTGTVVALVARAPLGSTREPSADTRTPSLAPRVSYTVGGRAYDYTAAHGRYRQRLQVGDRVTVLYAPDNPSSARLQGEGQASGPLITVGFVVAAVLLVVALLRRRRPGPPAPRRDQHGPALAERARDGVS